VRERKRGREEINIEIERVEERETGRRGRVKLFN
jgi:hypothetical protein